jgi:raffinose/stachyose/melibiose transport system permease protein
LLVYLAFFVYPFIQLVILSFQRWDGIKPKRWVGLANYQRLLFEDPKFWLSVRHNVLWMVAALVVPVAIGRAAAGDCAISEPIAWQGYLPHTLFYAPGAVLGGGGPDLELDL